VRVFDGDYSQSKEEAYGKFQSRQRQAHGKEQVRKLREGMTSTFQKLVVEKVMGAKNTSASPQND
jgi:hypothetical protein